ncbi:MAG: CAP domain-containing protein [Actinomycetota bacterium]
MRTARKISIMVVALVVMTVGLAVPAHAGAEGAFLSKINASRAAAGLPPVASHSGLASFARSHSAEMMAAGDIFHSDNLGSAASGWEALAENVGVGPSVDSLHSAFMNSSGHRRNILGNYNYAGVGVVESDGALWVTVVFMRKDAPPPPTTTTTTTTTVPPTTTTTVAPPPPPAPTPTTTTTVAPPPPPAPTTTTTTTVPAQAKKASNTKAPAPAPAQVEKMVPFGTSPHLPIAD